jgi:hypothetical protein
MIHDCRLLIKCPKKDYFMNISIKKAIIGGLF